MARAGGPLVAAAAGLRAAAMAVSGAAVVGMMALVTFEVLLRTFANRSTLVADEMAGYLLVAMTFLGLAPSLRDGAFIRIDTYRDRLRGGARRLLDVALVTLALAYAITVDWYLWDLLAGTWRLGTTSIQVSRTPLWIPQAVMAVGGLLLILELLVEMVLVITADEALPAGESTVA
ncbi:MAG TPA: TRAP transporter small permease [Methylomirabilota bacterium]|jgi:TRAP-type C4-dicarboxylate transport system permease small subunit|nr:TRAP transporter small permease [Methylomirabilota bacterium]